MLPRNQRQEALSRAYVRTIAAQAGLTIAEPENDYGIDMTLRTLTIRDGRRRDVGPQIDLQLKSTTRVSLGATHLSYDLDVVSSAEGTPAIAALRCIAPADTGRPSPLASSTSTESRI